jgi:AraC-like DNA-binding protein
MLPLRRLALLLALATAAGMAVVAAPVLATDSHAPNGARGDWLPSSEWVMSSWLPYDEARLYRLLGIDRAQLGAWLDDKRTLAELARRHGFRSPRALARKLVAGRHVSPTLRARLERRALDTLTQAHLARHVFFHAYHTPALANAARRVFGVSPARFRHLRGDGYSPIGIATLDGRSPAQLRAALLRLFRARGHRAVRLGAMSPMQAAALYAEQRTGVDDFMRHPYRTTAQQQRYAQQERHAPPPLLCELGT